MCVCSLQRGERAGELLLPRIAVSLISVRERERGYGDRERGGAGLLRNVNHRSSSEELEMHINCGSKEGKKGVGGSFPSCQCKVQLFLGSILCFFALTHSLLGEMSKVSLHFGYSHAWTSNVKIDRPNSIPKAFLKIVVPV